MNQKEGVFKAICEVLGATSFDSAVTLSTEQKSEVYEQVTRGFMEHEIDMTDAARDKYDTEEKVRKEYVPGLVNNWLRKDTRLNGGETYQIKNPGSRAGSTDPIVKELRKLKKTLTDKAQQEAVQKEIDVRLAKINAEKAKTVTIDIDKIPEELRHLINE